MASSYRINTSGPYILTLARTPGTLFTAPGDSGGALLDGDSQEGVIPVGDLDVWTLGICRGSTVRLRCEKLGGTGGFQARIRLYGRDGMLLASAQSGTVAALDYQATETGYHTVIVDSATMNQSGEYRLLGTGISGQGLTLCIPVVSDGLLDLGAFGARPTPRSCCSQKSTRPLR